jgi:hypothetical protein
MRYMRSPVAENATPRESVELPVFALPTRLRKK